LLGDEQVFGELTIKDLHLLFALFFCFRFSSGSYLTNIGEATAVENRIEHGLIIARIYQIPICFEISSL